MGRQMTGGTKDPLPSGAWRVRYQALVGGRWQRAAKTFRTEVEADDFIAENEKTLRHGEAPKASSDLTLSEWLEQWLRKVQTTVRKGTFDSYAYTVRLHLVPGFRPGLRLRDLTPEAIEQYRDIKLKDVVTERRCKNGKVVWLKDPQPLSASSVSHQLSILRRALYPAVRDGHVQTNVATLVKKPRTEDPDVTPLEPEEVARFLDAAERWTALATNNRGTIQPVTFERGLHRQRVAVLFRLALDSSARQGELLGLRWRNVSADGTRITVVQALRRDGTFGDPKRRASKRTITVLHKLTAQALMDLRERTEGQADDLVFGGQESRGLIRAFHTVLRLAGLRGFRFHSLRHTSITAMLNDRERFPSYMAVSQRAGHAKADITLGVYGHLLNQPTVDSAEYLAGLHGGRQRVEARR